MPQKSDELAEELIRLMPVQSDNGWGPNPIVCRWCECWLEYTDSSRGKPEERHAQDCFAVKFLNRPMKGD